ncbi:single-stranded DNA-binding protein [Campylobacter coli]|uniref:single-stranded DNA-binding protein n=1 Tax=Campylobacter jejuni TaxID=197 RepID=UPI0008754E2D|nr:single-stranded DNA-binding protein [Campylobacter jejuni]EAJ2471106.1 single-stranded DNA-binding protein [Campylobacter coli]EAH5595103.1 single-stranded DNA-binding protein [Campylobacter jejuni]EAH5857160.1 single-stranded DNA-binding protein [Campylobacter jejuni]EAH6153173.1 single-stranded DNA-binding protein [Campylobacter jejuni]EAH7582932.1 single-stranded DNA-binding protein [Campylobacter jejuni]
MNNVNLIGYLGKDFEIGTTNSGRVYAKNSLAITKRWKNERGNEESSTTWIPIVLFGKSAESASTHIKKGSQFACSGELSSNQYQDEDGNTRTMLTVIVSKFYWLGKKDKDDNGTQNPQVPPKEPNIDYENTNIESEETQVF